MKKQLLYFLINPQKQLQLKIIQSNNNSQSQIKITMLGIIILVFQILMIILFGIFIRTDSIITFSLSSIDSSLFFIAAYAYLSIKSRNLDWTVLMHYLFIVMICFQINTLYYYFWMEAFTQTFTSTTSLSTNVFVSGVQATLTVIITISFFTSRLSQLSVFIITMVQVFFFALNWGICRWGINAISSGGVSTVWLFGLTFAACIRKLRYPDLKQSNTSKYFTKTLQLIGLIIIIITWPSLNQIMAVLDSTIVNLDANALLQQNAYFQTWLCLFSCIVTTLGLRVSGEKIKLEKIIPSIINTGILISSCACVIIDPFASILVGICGPLIYFAYDRYGQILKQTGYPFDGIFMAFLGGIFSAIFAGGRNGRTPALSSQAVKQGGLQFAALLVSLIFAIIFGLITGFLLRFVTSDDVELTDMGTWQIQLQMLPLYSDDPKLEKLYKIQDRERLQQQNAHFSLKQRYLTSKINFSNSDRKIIRQQIQNTYGD